MDDMYSVIIVDDELISRGYMEMMVKTSKRYQIAAMIMYVAAPLFVSCLTIMVYGLSIADPVMVAVLLLMYCVITVTQGREQEAAEKDLNLASAIQENVLPRVFPPYPDRKDIDIY